MPRFSAILIASTALASPSWAASDPATMAGSNDTRIRSVDYSTTIVTRITSTNMVPITIVFGETEHATMISGMKVFDSTPKPRAQTDPKDQSNAAGEACTDWCADRHANELTLQPLKADNGSMLLITTERPDPANTSNVLRHHYAYELRTRLGQITNDGQGSEAKKPDDEAYFRVTYTYSAEDKARAQAEWRESNAARMAAAAATAQKVKADEKMKMAQFGGDRIFKWTRGNSTACDALAPFSVSDNGQFTNVVFKPNAPVSVPNKYNGPGKQETALSWHADKASDSSDIVVIESVPDQFVLRRNDQACLFQRDPGSPLPTIRFTGTSSPEVVRAVSK